MHLIDEKSPPLKRKSLDKWSYLPSWERIESINNFYSLNLKKHKCLIVSNQSIQAAIIIDLLNSKNVEMKVIKNFESNKPHLDPSNSLIIDAIKDWPPDHILFIPGDIQKSQDINSRFHSIVQFIQRVTDFQSEGEITLSLITNGIFNVLGTESLSPEKSLLIGPFKVLSKEIENFRCHLIDVEIPQNEQYKVDLFSRILTDIFTSSHSFEAAYRGRLGWVQKYQSIPLPEGGNHSLLLKKGGSYLITGGTGGIGCKIAEYLGTKWNAQLVLTTRRSSQSEEDNASFRRMRKTVQLLEDKKIDFNIVQADAADFDQMEEIFKSRYDRGGKFDGIIHAAGMPGGGFIQLRNRDQFDAVLQPKVQGIAIISRLLKTYSVDFLVSFSSLSAILGEIGQADYCSANCFLDAATYQVQEMLDIRAISINWARWEATGMAEIIKSNPHHRESEEELQWISPHEGLEIFEKILTTDFRQIIVSPYDINSLLHLQKLDPLVWFK